MSPYLANVSNILHIWVAIHLEFGSGGENHSGNRENKGRTMVGKRPLRGGHLLGRIT